MTARLLTIPEVADRLNMPISTLRAHIKRAYDERPDVVWVAGRGTKHPRMSEGQVAAMEVFIWPEAFNTEAADFIRQASGAGGGTGAGPSTATGTSSARGQVTARKPSASSAKHFRSARATVLAFPSSHSRT